MNRIYSFALMLCGKLMAKKGPRYQAVDPTNQGFYQIIDTRDRRRIGKRKKFLNDDGIETSLEMYDGTTRVLANFTAYCPNARLHAEDLTDRLNKDAEAWRGSGARVLRERLRQGFCDTVGTDSGDIHLLDTTRNGLSVVMISQKWLPSAPFEAVCLADKLNTKELGRFKLFVIEGAQ